MIMEQSEKKLFIVKFLNTDKEQKEVKVNALTKYEAEKIALSAFRREQPDRMAYTAQAFRAQLSFF
jgi:hypothetical protein